METTEEEKLGGFRCSACKRVSSALSSDGLCLSPKCRKEEVVKDE